jgi:guanylate kinase
VILEIDWQGHQQIKKLFPDASSVFILPPSLRTLKKRLVTRNQDDAKTIEKRIADVKETIKHVPEFDYLVVNDDFDFAVHDLCCIIESGRLKAKRQAAKFKKQIAELA